MNPIPNPQSPIPRASRAWSLVELLLVLSIIAILVGAVARMVIRADQKTALDRTKAELDAIALAIEQYKSDYGAYPMSAAFSNSTVCTTLCDGVNPPLTLPNYSTFPAAAADCYARTALCSPAGAGCTIATYLPSDAKVIRNATALWVWLYREPILAGKKPYIVFAPRQLVDTGIGNPGTPAGMPANLQMVVDAWGNPYNYDAFTPDNGDTTADAGTATFIVRTNRASFDLISAGPNGQYGDGDDITNAESH